jgi:hypothetical protein
VLSWQTQTIVSGNVLLEPNIAQDANFQTSLPSLISTKQVKPVRRMRHSSQSCFRTAVAAFGFSFTRLIFQKQSMRKTEESFEIKENSATPGGIEKVNRALDRSRQLIK